MRAVFDYCVEDSSLKEAMAYSLFAEGKRFRPLLLLSVYEVLNRKSEVEKKNDIYVAESNEDLALYFAIAIECIHTYSLIHDDLPCMDDDDMRRGKPSLHKVYGEAEALIAGDALLNLAVELMSDAVASSSNGERLRRSARAMHYVLQRTGASGMVLGQSLDIAAMSNKENLSITLVEKINKYKTAALIQSSIGAGAILGGVDESMFSLVEELGEQVGQIFQLTDDLLDMGDSRSDCSYPALVGVKKTREIVEKMGIRAKHLACELSMDFLVDCIDGLLCRER